MKKNYEEVRIKKLIKKDGIAVLIILMFILVHFSNAYDALDKSLLHQDAMREILWNLGVFLLVIVSGLFVIIHFVKMMDDLRHYRTKEMREEERGA